jgi:hypothetical protein
MDEAGQLNVITIKLLVLKPCLGDISSYIKKPVRQTPKKNQGKDVAIAYKQFC